MSVSKKHLVLTVSLLGGWLGLTQAQAAPFTVGDVLAANNNGTVRHYNNAGTYLGETLNTGLGGYTTGMAFDSAGNLYVTNFSAGGITKFANADPHANLGPFGIGHTGSPESIVFDAAGNAYVGYAFGDADIRKFAAAGGAATGQYPVATQNVGSDWIDLAADQKTMFYTSEGTTIFRYDVTGAGPGVQLAPFNLLPLPGSNAFALRIRNNGDVIVADRQSIIRLDSSGAQIQTYDAPGEDSWFALNLDPDGNSFWSGDFGTDNFYKFDIATGSVLVGPINTGTGGNLYGLTVFGEMTAANDPVPTASTWGLVLLTVVLIAGGMWYFRDRAVSNLVAS